MSERSRESRVAPGVTRHKWFNSPVSFHAGTLNDVCRLIPSFERRCFGLTQPGDEKSRLNEHLSMIVRLPHGEDSAFIPVGVVSKDYCLVQHTVILDVAARGLEALGIPPTDVKAELRITEYGERMAVSLYLPDRYNFDPGDGNPMALRLECFNSVDGSTRFRALMGWFRFVCSNGLVIGVTHSDVCRRHVGDVRPEDVGTVLMSCMSEAETEKKSFVRWRKTQISLSRLAPWVDEDLRKEWGFKAAARAYHIALSGSDAEVLGPYQGNRPTTIAMRETVPVPGVPRECRNLFDVSQILAWLAKERRDLQEQLEWREGIASLMAPLVN